MVGDVIWNGLAVFGLVWLIGLALVGFWVVWGEFRPGAWHNREKEPPEEDS